MGVARLEERQQQMEAKQADQEEDIAELKQENLTQKAQIEQLAEQTNKQAADQAKQAAHQTEFKSKVVATFKQCEDGNNGVSVNMANQKLVFAVEAAIRPYSRTTI